MKIFVNKLYLLIFILIFNLSSCVSIKDTHFKPIILPQTGQTTSYHPGDDGALQRGVKWPEPRFINHGNGTITDRLTGLMWEAKPRKQHVDWYQAFKRINELNREKLGGFSDWRMPNINELATLVNFSVKNNIKYLARLGFDLSGTKRIGSPNNNGTFYDVVRYWSSTDRSDDPKYASQDAAVILLAWDTPKMGFASKLSKQDIIKYNYLVGYSIGVRTGQQQGVIQIPRTGQTKSYHAGDDGDLQHGAELPNNRFVNNNDGTITDRLTNLMWQNTPGNQQYIWKHAFKKIKELNKNRYSGYSDWRLPNILELKSLYNHKYFHKKWLSNYGFKFYNDTYFLWSSTSQKKGFAFIISPYHFDFKVYGNSTLCHVIAVRGG